MLIADAIACERGGRRLFSDLAFTLPSGEWLQVEGENGAGKTSLLRIVAGLTPPSAGEIRWDGQLITDSADAYRADLLYLGHVLSVKEELTPVENLCFSAAAHGDTLHERDAVAALRQIGLRGREHVAARFLSQGQKRRAALARLCLSRARLWVLDEPFVALDVAAVALLQDLLGEHLSRGGAVLFTSHQPASLNGPGRTLSLLQ